jgi:hypothetical protein
MDGKTLHQITTYTTLIPLCAGILRFKTAAPLLRLFLFFLAYGFVTDVLIGMLYETHKSLSHSIYLYYSLAESIFLLCIIGFIANERLVKKLCYTTAAMMIPFWIILFYVRFFIFYIEVKVPEPQSVFDPSYQVIVAAFSASLMLRMAEEKKDLERSPVFWIVVGIFFYCFTTFFISLFQDTDFIGSIWYIHNLTSIISNLFFTIGYLAIPLVRSRTNLLFSRIDS